MTSKYRDNLDDEFFRHLPRIVPFSIGREILALPIVIICMLGLFIALFLVGVKGFAYYQAQAAKNRIARIILSPPRGEIIDRNGVPLAVNHLVYDCYFITSDDLEADINEITDLGTFLELPAEQLNALLENRRAYALTRSMESELWAAGRGSFGARSILVKRDLNKVEVTAVLERSVSFPRAYVVQAYRRSYPAGETAAQVVGYMGEISASELGNWSQQGYGMGDIVGKAGLERQYDRILRGEAGYKLVSVDAKGRIIGEAQGVPAVVPDDGVVVVHEGEVAVLLENETANFGRRGTSVSLKNGIVEGRELSVMISGGQERTMPRVIFSDDGDGGNFDGWRVFRRPGEVVIVDNQVVIRPSLVPPSGGATLRTTIDIQMQREIDLILGDTVGGILAMDPRDGSILAMVSEPGYDPNLFAPGGVDRSGWQRILDDPHYPLLNRPVQNAYVPGSTFKIVTSLAALEENVATRYSTWTCHGSIEVGNRTFRCWNRGGHGTVDFIDAIAHSCDVAFWEMGQDLGYEPIAHMAYTLGFGELTGIDLPDERRGLIPSDEWKRGRFGERWFTGDTMNMAIGQGFVQLTLVQEAVMVSAVANGGYRVTPHFNRLLTPAPSALEHIPVSDANIRIVAQGMRSVVVRGTARSNLLDWLEIAGKTGTADDPPREDPHSWFVSYAPYTNPVMVLVVFGENGGHGDEKAAPMAARIWQCSAVRNYLASQGVNVPQTPANPGNSN